LHINYNEGVNSICFYNGKVMTGFSLMEECAVLIEDGLVADVFSRRCFEQKRFGPGTEVYDVHGAYIAPGFIDIHIHGYGGYGTEDAANYWRFKPVLDDLTILPREVLGPIKVMIRTAAEAERQKRRIKQDHAPARPLCRP